VHQTIFSRVVHHEVHQHGNADAAWWGAFPSFSKTGKSTGVSGLTPRRSFGGVTRTLLSDMVAGGRYELYSNYPLQIQAVAASVATTAA
jgi:hypothetical protein